MAKVTGLEQFRANLAHIKAAARAAMSAAVEESARELAEAIRANAPRGKTGDLAASVKYQPSNNARGDARIAFTVSAGDHKAYYARWVEFGTAFSGSGRHRDAHGKTRTSSRVHHATTARPFFWPTYRLMKRRIKSRITRSITKAVFIQRSV